jgi:hypothetical protein
MDRATLLKRLTSVIGKQVGVLGVLALAVVLFVGAGSATASSPYDTDALELIHWGNQMAEDSFYNTGDSDAHSGWLDAYQADGYATTAFNYDSRSQWYKAYTYALLAAQFMLTSYDTTGDPNALFAAIYLYNGAVECLDAYLYFE